MWQKSNSVKRKYKNCSKRCNCGGAYTSDTASTVCGTFRTNAWLSWAGRRWKGWWRRLSNWWRVWANPMGKKCSTGCWTKSTGTITCRARRRSSTIYWKTSRRSRGRGFIWCLRRWRTGAMCGMRKRSILWWGRKTRWRKSTFSSSSSSHTQSWSCRSHVTARCWTSCQSSARTWQKASARWTFCTTWRSTQTTWGNWWHSWTRNGSREWWR